MCITGIRDEHLPHDQGDGDDRQEEDLDAAYAINGDGPFATATITVDGTAGEYVIVATGFAD